MKWLIILTSFLQLRVGSQVLSDAKLVNKTYRVTKSPINKIFKATDYFVNNKIVFRVINGTAAKEGDVPYQVALMKKTSKDKKGRTYQAYCGGAIIKPKSVLTAAHCVVKERTSDCFKGKLWSKDLAFIFAVAGTLITRDSYTVPNTKSGAQWRTIRCGYYPTDFNFPRSDIALLKTLKPFEYTENVIAVPYAKEHLDYGGLFCRVSGYGYTDPEKKTVSDKLLTAYIQVLSKQKCDFIHNRKMTKFICTSDNIADVYKGDSGGPLVCKGTRDSTEYSTKEGKQYGLLVGLVSGKTKDKVMTTFFTRVSKYHTLIASEANIVTTEKSLLLVIILLNIALLLF